MSGHTPVPLTADPIGLTSPEFSAILKWPFADPFVGRLLNEDIPQRVQLYDARLWIYRDPQACSVGFGSLQIGNDCDEFTDGMAHTYIPLLAVNPAFLGKGHGKSIIRNLIGEAALLVQGHRALHSSLWLDAYTTSTAAIGLYAATGFRQISPAPIPDPLQGGATYIVMARRV